MLRDVSSTGFCDPEYGAILGLAAWVAFPYAAIIQNRRRSRKRAANLLGTLFKVIKPGGSDV
jgi:hypothetical protein